MSKLRPLAPIKYKINYMVMLFLLTMFIVPIMPLSEYDFLLAAQDEQPTISLNVELVVLHPIVQDRNRNSISGLTKTDFKVYEDGIIQKIESFSQAYVPVTVGLVVDSSGTMRSKQREVITAGLAFARSCTAEDEVFVVNFNENVSFGLPDKMLFTNQPIQLHAAFSKTPKGKTALYDAIAAALDHVQKGNRDKKVLIVISDGGDNASKLTLAQTLALVKHSNTIIYAIGLFDKDDRDSNPNVLKQLASVTGGIAFLPKLVNEIGPISQQILKDFRNQYTITYTPENSKQDGSYRTIKVTATTANYKHLTVRARAGYYSPKKP